MASWLRQAVEALGDDAGTTGSWARKLAEGLRTRGTFNGSTVGPLTASGSWLRKLYLALDPRLEFPGSNYIQLLSGGGGPALVEAVLSAGGDDGVPDWVPMGAIGFADFTTGASGNYWDGTAAVTADEMFESDESNYGVRFLSNTITGSGFPGGSATLASDFTTPGGKIVGLLGDAMFDGCQLVATFARVDGSGGQDASGLTFEATFQPDWDTDWLLQSDEGYSAIRDYGGVDGEVQTDAATANGTTKFAAEIDPGVALKASVNGGAVIDTTATKVGGHGINRINFKVSAFGGTTCHLRSLAIYPVGYAALNALSA